jgi:uncharacterized protein YbaA (DUF1428 family)
MTKKMTKEEMMVISCNEAEPLWNTFRQASDGYRSSAILVALATFLGEMAIRSLKNTEGEVSTESTIEFVDKLARELIKATIDSDPELKQFIKPEASDDRIH